MSKNNQESGQDFFEKYLESLESSSVIDPMSFVMQCPPEVRPELISAFAAIEAALQFHDEEVSVTPEECLQLNETLASLKRREELVKRSEATGLTYREVLFEDARQRLASAKELFRVQPVECMAESLNFGGVANRIGTLYRDSQGRKRNATSLGIDVTWIRSREDALRSEAESLLRSANALAEPINLDSVAHYIGVLVEKAPLDSNFSMEGCLVTDGVVCGIIINTNPALGTLERHRYTLGHEIGHATLHKESGINVFQDTDSELRNY